MRLGWQERMLAGDQLYKDHTNPKIEDYSLDKALDQYFQALEENKDCPVLMSRIAKTFLKAGQYGKGEDYARKSLHLLDKMPTDSETRTDIAGIKENIQASREAHMTLGRVRFNQGHWMEARQSFWQAIHAAPWQSCRAWYGLFEVCFDESWLRFVKTGLSVATLQNWTQAGFSMMMCLGLFWFDPDTRSLIGKPLTIQFSLFPYYLIQILYQLIRAWIYDEIGQNQRAIDQYLTIHQRYPGFAFLGRLLAHAFYRLGDREQSRYWLEKTLHKHPGDWCAYSQLAALLDENEDSPGLKALSERMLKLKPTDPQVFCLLGNSEYALQNFKESLDAYESALQLSIQSCWASASWKAMIAQNIAHIHWEVYQNAPLATGYYQMAYSLDPNNVELALQLGVLYFQMENFQNSEMIYRQTLNLCPDSARIHANLGYLRWMAGDVEEAVQCYLRAITLDGDYAIAINNLGVIYLDMQGRIQEAIEMFQQALSINRDYALAYYNLGRAYSFMERRSEAAESFQMAKALNNNSSELDNDELTARINHLFETPR